MPIKDKNIVGTRSYLKSKILNDYSLVGCENERKQVENLMRRTVENGESNSMLLIGPRSSGKSTLIKNILDELNEDDEINQNSVLVQLHGLVHTDDRLALKCMTAEMGLDNAVDGKVFGSFAENLAFLLACLKSGTRNTSKSVIIIIEEFDLFCAHHNQTLLYNLFDVSQSAQTPLCIVGVTCRLDVIELLEKRVKSRFSHRQIFLFPGENMSKDTTELDVCLNRIEYLLTFTDGRHPNLHKNTQKQWNASVKSLVADKQFKQLMQRLLEIDYSERTLRNILLQVVCSLSTEKPTINYDDFQKQINKIERDEMLEFLQDLSVLELCLLIAMKHHCDIYDNQPMNFEMIYSRYIKFANTNCNMQAVQRPVVMKAFEHIQRMELIGAESQGSKLQREYQMFRLLVQPQQILECVSRSYGIPTEVVQWAGSSIA